MRRSGSARTGRGFAAVVLVAVSALGSASGCASRIGAVAGPVESRLDAAVATATFDTVWHVVGETYPYSDMRGVDWERVRADYRPRAARAETIVELRALLNEVLGLLGESHAVVLPEDLAPVSPVPGDSSALPGSAGFAVRQVGDTVVVWEVAQGGGADEAGIRAGDELVAVQGVRVSGLLATVDTAVADSPARELLLAQVLEQELSGRVGARRQVTVRRTAGVEAVVDLELGRPRGAPMLLGPMPVAGWLSHERLEVPGATVGYIRFNLWLGKLAPAFDSAVDALRDADGIVIDLRGNPGGELAMVHAVGGHFSATPLDLGTRRFRRGEMGTVVLPRQLDTEGRRVPPFSGHVAVLVDGVSASSSEVFAGGLQAAGRARVFGSRTAGMALPAHLRLLPSGDRLMHPVADFHLRDGRRLEGVGLEPDETIRFTRSHLSRGRDPALEAAIDWIARNRSITRTRERGSSC